MSTIELQTIISDVLIQSLSKRIIGQEEILEKCCIGLLTNGHCLLEGMPGLAKTLIIKSIAESCNLSFSRIQFTPDLLPSDITGTMIYKQKSDTFEASFGPIFNNIVLADEINRAPAKVQSALLEAMQEHQVSLGGKTYPLNKPFLVLATQNPIEQEGTYPLPEAQQDRFLLKIECHYPERSDEKTILKNLHQDKQSSLKPVLSLEDLNSAKQAVKNIHIDEKIIDYVLDLVRATRNPKDAGVTKLVGLLEFGASPRGAEALLKAAQAHAYIKKRQFVSPEDIKAIAHDALRHRICPSFEAEGEGISHDNLINILLSEVQVP